MPTRVAGIFFGSAAKTNSEMQTMRSGKTIMIHKTLIALFLLVGMGCGTVPPTPDPVPSPIDASPNDPFAGLVADCDADSAQSPSVLSPANSCLASDNPVDPCMIDLLVTWPADAIACAARFLSVRSSISVAGGDAGAAERSTQPRARAWLLDHNVQCKN